MAWINGYQEWLSGSQSLQNAQKVVDYLYRDDKDWTKEAISALIGNMRHESSLNPNMYEYGYSWSSDRGFGLVQWTPRSKYWNWGQAAGYTEAQLRSGDAQLARIDFGVENNIQWIKTSSYPLTFTEFRTSTESVDYLTSAFTWNYERPNATAGAESQPARKAFAQRAFNELDWSKTDKPDIPDEPAEPDDNPGGVDVGGFVNELNTLIEKMLSADLVKAGNSNFYQNGYLQLVSQMGNMFKIKPNDTFFNAIKEKFDDFNGGYIPTEPPPDPDQPPDPVPEPGTRVFPVKLGNGINFYKRSAWGVGTLQRNMTYGTRSNGDNHFGYDIGGGGVNHQIYSVTSGTVVRANYAAGIGNRVTIQNDSDSYFLEYGHLDSIGVKVGDKVVAGQPIGVMGKTGGNYAIHLDVKIATSVNGFYSWDSTINPEGYLGIDRDHHTTLQLP